MDENGVMFKGTVNGLTIIMKEEHDFEYIYDQIEKKIFSAGNFFKGVSMVIRYRGKGLSKDEEDRIVELMTLKGGADIKNIAVDTDEQNRSVEDPDGYAVQKSAFKKFGFFKGIIEGMTRFHRGTVRSGQLIDFDGNIVVLGDVNPGAEIIAAGNVIVMGTLRGIVHAGSDGNRDAVVVALNLQPTQLRIADVITRPPDENADKSRISPELAFVRDNTVYIEAL